MMDNLIKKQPPNIGVVIQARQTSKRFPGKSMALLNGVPVLEHVIRNAKMIRPVNRVIVAVPDTKESEPMLTLANKLGVFNFCGSENDVLGRYIGAATYFKLDVIVRITADCPFINPLVCNEVLNLLMYRKLDYCTNCFPVRTYPRGLDCEAFTWEALDAADQSTKHGLDASDLSAEAIQARGDREHVTPWMQRTMGLRKANIQQHEDASKINLCVDYPEDIERLEKQLFEV